MPNSKNIETFMMRKTHFQGTKHESGVGKAFDFLWGEVFLKAAARASVLHTPLRVSFQ